MWLPKFSSLQKTHTDQQGANKSVHNVYPQPNEEIEKVTNFKQSVSREINTPIKQTSVRVRVHAEIYKDQRDCMHGNKVGAGGP